MSDETRDYGWDAGLGLTLLAKLREDLKTATRGRDELRKNTIRIIMGEFPKLTVPITLESGKKTTRPKRPEEITDSDILGVIRGLVKSERYTLELKKEASSPYLAALESYLPAMASRETIAAWVTANVDLSKLKGPMQAMGPVMKHFGQQADGTLVRAVLEELTKARG
ncbi:MAG: GatB/YqeY domain-containing protein [Thermodesulfobacteriota bacterium]